jgi:hypothetical protein
MESELYWYEIWGFHSGQGLECLSSGLRRCVLVDVVTKCWSDSGNS